MTNGKYDKDDWQFWVFVICAWAAMPLMCVWVMATHPGRCAWIWYKVVNNEWDCEQPTVSVPTTGEGK
jgi:hypothetical protein